MIPSSFPLLQVTPSSSWPWLHSVRWEQFACSNGFRPGGLEQLRCAWTGTCLSITPGNDWAKQRGAGSGTMVQPARAALARSAHCLWHRRERRHLQPRRGAGGLEWAAQACKETMLPFLRETWVFPSPAYPTFPSTDLIHSLCFCPGVFLGPFSLEIMQNAISKSKSPTPTPCQIPSVWLLGPFYLYFGEVPTFGEALSSVKSKWICLSLVIISPSSPPPPGLQ